MAKQDKSSLAARLLSKAKTEGADIFADSKFFTERKESTTPIPMLNVALSGSFDGGLSAGVTMCAGPSKHFKTNLSLAMIAPFMEKYPDAVCLFFDSEFGASFEYFDFFGIDKERVVHVPVSNIEDMKFNIMGMLEELTRKDNVVVFVDSIGNMASKKEVEDALNEKSVADMTRAKALKGLFRMVTPLLAIKDIPFVCVNHTYSEMSMHPRQIVGGGTGSYYAANAIFIIRRRQIKEGTDVVGYEFIIDVDKSRSVKERSSVPITVTFDGGIDPYSGLLDVGTALGYIDASKKGWYSRNNVPDDKGWRRKDTSSDEFWKPVLEDEKFLAAVKRAYMLSGGDGEATHSGIVFDEETGEILQGVIQDDAEAS
jgi:RecA/RadA recombinase